MSLTEEQQHLRICSDEQTFPRMFCPGETQPVSQAVHLMRLRSGWEGCDECVWRDHAAGLSETSLKKTESLRNRQHSGIHRGSLGIRGVWHNDLNRCSAASLAQVFATEICKSITPESNSDSSRPATHESSILMAKVQIVSGYDGRTESLEMYSEVITAIRQSGCDVLDAGRATHASLQEILRSNSSASAAIYVTGCGGKVGVTGFDIFDRKFEGIGVPWHQYGVVARLKTQGDYGYSAQSSVSSSKAGLPVEISRTLVSIRQSKAPSGVTVDDAIRLSSLEKGTSVPGAKSETVLQMPSGNGGFRNARCSGQACVIDYAARYQHWLNRWFPGELQHPIVVVVQDELIESRLTAIQDVIQCSVPLHIIRVPLLATKQHAEVTLREHLQREHAVAGFVIPEDDRCVTVFNQLAEIVDPRKLVSWLNQMTQSSASHVTAHVSPVDERIVLQDIGRPDGSEASESICDGLAIMGLALRIMQANGSRLPIA